MCVMVFSLIRHNDNDNPPDWTRQLNVLVQRVAKEMGCLNRNVSAKFYKMLLYKKGGHFLKNRETEKEKISYSLCSSDIINFDLSKSDLESHLFYI